ncbi:hypothetical protein KIN20_026443 [Parelaphostrongylus tenuis]|uniref:Uncharacterized protein n=1 Tax=Parelaphostrongylus tenuis TaxID=148309 RepID=A0AAD5QY56_PARTN|nr:hypothetical protein KIN20_026443 [Parelaphostrongylus tenuis]
MGVVSDLYIKRGHDEFLSESCTNHSGFVKSMEQSMILFSAVFPFLLHGVIK